MNKISPWIKTFRLRTLPLAFSCIIMGSALAYSDGRMNFLVLILALLTTLFLQILSNIANDYGDGIKGTDNNNRVGPERAIQSGEISVKNMKRLIILFIFLSLAAGITLIIFGLKNLPVYILIIFLLIGIFAIISAVKYTVGKIAYGYHGFGDLFVLIFFGIVGVIGSYYLHTHSFKLELLLPAFSLGFLSVGVLNLNNMRDRNSDKLSGKITIAVILGDYKARIYHGILLILSIIFALIFVIINYRSIYQFGFLLVTPLILSNIITVLKSDDPGIFDKLLMKLALSTFIFSILFGIGINIV
ncbi:1,4-dihydroxy-2-naphthoate polyprenyltransferase [Bacteroidota bacterium]